MSEKANYRAKAVLKSLGELTPEQLEDISIGAEEELSKREELDNGDLLIKLTSIDDKIKLEEETWGRVGGISTGYPSLDARIGGMKKGELILIAGKPKNGKSALAQNIAVNASRAGEKVLFITLELLAQQTGVRMKHMNDGKIPENVYVQSKHRMDYRHLKPLFEQAVEQGVSVVMLDYLQFMGRGMTLEEVAKMSKEMKTLALEFEVPFIVIVSLRKSTDMKFSKWTSIELDDISGTSSIGYDADSVLLCSRRDENNEFVEDKMHVKIIAVRSMREEEGILQFNWNKTRITEGWVPRENDIQNGGLAYKD